MGRSYAHLFAVTIVFALIGAALSGTSNYYLYVATAAAWLAILAISFDVLLGYTGYLSLAHGALYGIGAYACANLTVAYGWNFWPALVVSGLIAAAAGAAVALAAFRTHGLYFAVVTLGMGLVGFQLFLLTRPLTGGIVGYVGIPSIPVFPGLEGRQVLSNFLLALLIAWLVYLAAYFFTRSRIGIACIAIREDATLTQSLGIGVGVPRLCAFTFSAFFAGIAGALFAASSNFVGPESFGVLTTGFHIVVAVVVGGMGTLWGAALGAVLLTTLPELLRGASTYSLLAYGVLLLLFVRFAPKGIAGLIRAGLARLRTQGSERDAIHHQTGAQP